MKRHPIVRLSLLALLAMPLAACESMDMDLFNKKEPPLPGVRHNVLPGGVAPPPVTLPMPADVSGTRTPPAQAQTTAPRRRIAR